MNSRRKLLLISAAAAVVAIAADVFLVLTEHHATPIWGSGLVAYWPVFAVFWFLVFVFGSKWIGKAGVQQREDYYETPGSGDAEERRDPVG
ncbi:MAG: hypothetical protein ACYSVY_16775 [Planctomycetota bacterium]|jgi:hypothetical protein